MAAALVTGGCGDDDASGDDDDDAVDGGDDDDSGDDDDDSGDDDDDSGDDDDDSGDDDDDATCVEDEECDDGNPCDGAESCQSTGCAPGLPPEEGTACDVDDDDATRDLCVGGGCTATRCGDGVLDAESDEECDDGNDRADDGCTDCRPDCAENDECDDGETCNGDEQCDVGDCVPGTPLEDDSTCDLGVCKGGVCTPPSCDDDADCDDGNVCTGAERCIETMCETGSVPDCDDDSRCTTDSCDPSARGGCLNVLVDADHDGQASATLGECGTDCDDMNPDVYVGARDACDAIDNDCDEEIDEDGVQTWFFDCDGDGYATRDAATMESCAEPPAPPVLGRPCPDPGWTTNEPNGSDQRDCNDHNAAVNPGQRMFQTSGITGQPPETDFDYDCNDDEEAQYDHTGACRVRLIIGGGFSCLASTGWADEVPECGTSAPYIAGRTDCVPGSAGVPSCVPMPASDRKQGCL